MTEFSVLSWNVQGMGFKPTRMPFKKVVPELLKKDTDIICLQEVPDAQKKLAEIKSLGHYHTFIPRLNQSTDRNTHGYNFNVLLSKHPFKRVEELVFPPYSKTGRAIESAISADIQIGKKVVRIYACHFVIRHMGVVTRLKQIDYILKDSLTWNGPLIICGDMNVAMPQGTLARRVAKWWHRWPQEEIHPVAMPKGVAEKDIFHRHVASHGFTEVLDLNTPTWSPLRDGWELFKLKLDWFLVKDLQPVTASLGNYLSDHRPIDVICRLGD